MLYGMDRGILLQMAGEYQASTAWLEQAEEEVERLYTRRLHTEALALFTNDARPPFEGEPHGQTMINVLKAINYATLGQWEDALLESRRIDHRLNIRSDHATTSDTYRDDAFARYVMGVLYEAAGDLDNAWVAYQPAHEAYLSAHASRMGLPHMLCDDLLRMSQVLHREEHFVEQ